MLLGYYLKEKKLVHTTFFFLLSLSLDGRHLVRFFKVFLFHMNQNFIQKRIDFSRYNNSQVKGI